MIIFAFFVVVFVLAGIYGLGLPSLMGNVLRRWGMYGILVLAMVPSIQSGNGPNFGVSLGIVCGLFGSLVAIELDIANLPIFESHPQIGAWASMLFAMVLAAVIGWFVGVGY